MTRRDILAAIAASVIAPRSRVSAQAGRSLKDTVADRERSFAGTMAKRDVNAFATHISPEAVFFGGPDSNTPLRGKTAIVEGWRPLFNGPNAPFSWTPDVTEVLDSGTLALTSGPVKNANGDVTGRFSSIWRLDADGAWRVIFDKGCQVCRS